MADTAPLYQLPIHNATAWTPAGRDDTYVAIEIPRNRMELPNDKSKSSKQKKQKDYRIARPTPPELVSDGRGFQTVRGYRPYEFEEEDTSFNLPKQPFQLPAEDTIPFKQGNHRQAMQNIQRSRGGLPTNEGGISEEEKAMAGNGLRWWYELENSFLMPGSSFSRQVMEGVDRENAWLGKMLQQAKMEKNNEGIMSPIAQVRLRGQWLSERNKAITDYINGNWDDPERAYKDFNDAIGKIDAKLIELGEDPALLRPVPPVAGKRSGFTDKTGPSKLRRQWNYANTVNNKLTDWISSGKINDPNFMGSSEVTTYLDSTYETLIKHLKESANAMADAEKKRLQILTLTDEGHDAVIKTIKAYQKALAGVMSSASAKDWSQNNKGKVNEVIKAMGFDPDKLDKASLGAQMAALGGVIVSSLSRNDELPHDVRTDLEAIQNQYDTYLENMMFAANVAPHIVASMASALGQSTSDAYNDQAFVSGRALADNLGDIEDLTISIPRNAVPMSKLLEPPQFIVPSLTKTSKAKVSTNPESVGENEPASTDTVPGVRFED